MLFKKWRNYFVTQQLSESYHVAQQWFDSPLGQATLDAEQALIDQVMHYVYGDYLLQLSLLDNIVLSSQSPVTHHFKVLSRWPVHADVSFVSQYECLPIATERVDGILLHHVLEYSIDPFRLLNEVGRIIAPNGYLVLIGFNPFHLLQLKKYFHGVSRQIFWHTHSLSVSRIKRWLRTLGFEPTIIRYTCSHLPIFSKRSLNVCQRYLPFKGAVYMIMARKQLTPMTLIKPSWKQPQGMPWVPSSKASTKNT